MNYMLRTKSKWFIQIWIVLFIIFIVTSIYLIFFHDSTLKEIDKVILDNKYDVQICGEVFDNHHFSEAFTNRRWLSKGGSHPDKVGVLQINIDGNPLYILTLGQDSRDKNRFWVLKGNSNLTYISSPEVTLIFDNHCL